MTEPFDETTPVLRSDGDPMEPVHPIDKPFHGVQCKATNRQGTRCRRVAVPGTVVCNMHGGNAPQVRRKASLRLLELIDPAIAVLAREMVQADKSQDRQRAANSILDRAGVSRRVDVGDAEAARDLLVQRLMQLRDQQRTIEGTVEKPTEG